MAKNQQDDLGDLLTPGGTPEKTNAEIMQDIERALVPADFRGPGDAPIDDDVLGDELPAPAPAHGQRAPDAPPLPAPKPGAPSHTIKLRAADGSIVEVPAAAMTTIKVDGQDVEVTVEEALRGYSRTADYTRKTQDTAEERRKTVEAGQRYLAQLEKLEVDVRPEERDWNHLRQTLPPDEYAALYADFQREEAVHEKAQGEIDRVKATLQEASQKEFRDKVEAGRKQLLEWVPEWKDPVVEKAEMTELVQFALTELHFTPEDIVSMTDPRAVLTIRKAKVAHDLAVSGNLRPEQRRPKPPALRPGSPPPPPAPDAEYKKEAARLKAKAKATGSKKDAQAYLEFILPY